MGVAVVGVGPGGREAVEPERTEAAGEAGVAVAVAAKEAGKRIRSTGSVVRSTAEGRSRARCRFRTTPNGFRSSVHH